MPPPPPPETDPPLKRWPKGIFFTLLLFFSTFWGSIFFLGPFLPLLFLARFLRESHPRAAEISLRCFRYITDHIVGAWLTLPPSLLYLWFGQETKLFGDHVLAGEPALFIMNHRTRLDWMFLWSPLMAFNTLNQLKVILKDDLKLVPGVGWAMQLNNFIFLRRKWDVDRGILTKMLSYASRIGRPTQLLLFPEGTDFEPRTKARSDAFALKNNLPIYDHVLHPRTTGFSYCVRNMVANRQIDAIYDVTIAYPRSVLQNELGMVTGAVPEEIHFNIRRYALPELAAEVDLTSEEAISQWCSERWKEKEESLAGFYSEAKPEDRKFLTTSSNHITSSASATTTTSSTTTTITTNNGHSSSALIEKLYVRMWISALFWTGSVLFQTYLFLTSTLVFYYSMTLIVVYFVATLIGGGMEIMESCLLQ